MSEEQETGWLIERSMNHGLEYLMADHHGLTWTTNVNAALRCARRADAEAICLFVDDADRVAEHLWG